MKSLRARIKRSLKITVYELTELDLYSGHLVFLKQRKIEEKEINLQLDGWANYHNGNEIITMKWK